MYGNKEQSRGGAGRCVRTEHCDGRCGETTLDLDHVRSEEDVLLPLAERG